VLSFNELKTFIKQLTKYTTLSNTYPEVLPNLFQLYWNIRSWHKGDWYSMSTFITRKIDLERHLLLYIIIV